MHIRYLLCIYLIFCGCVSIFSEKNKKARSYPSINSINTQEGKYGFIDKNGSLAIPARFKFIGDFSEGLAAGYGYYIDKSGSKVIEKEFYYNQKFSEGLAGIRIGNKKWYINKEGEFELGPFDYNILCNFSEGLAEFNVEDGRYGFIDKEGKIVISPIFDRVSDFNEGLAAVRIGRKDIKSKRGCKGYLVKEEWSFIDSRGKVVIKAKYNNVKPFSEGLAAVDVKGLVCHGGIAEGIGGKWGYINRQGKMIIKPKYDWANSFSEGMAVVRLYKDKYKKNKFGYINMKGKMVIRPKFQRAFDFSEGLAAVKINGKFGFIDKNGNFAIKPTFDLVKPFSEGFSPVKINGKWGYIDKTGKYLLKPQFIEAYCFSEGLARVKTFVARQ